MTDYGMTELFVTVIGLALTFTVGIGVTVYLTGLNSKNVKKAYLESHSKIISDRKALALELYSKNKSDEKVKTILDDILPLPKMPEV